MACLLGSLSVSLALAGQFSRRTICGLNFVAGVKGPPAGLDVGKGPPPIMACLPLGWGGFTSPSFPAPEVSTVRGNHCCSLDGSWSYHKPQLLDRSGWGMAGREFSTTLHWS